MTVKKQQYWDDDLTGARHALFDLECSIALRLIDHWGLIAGKTSDKEDSGGRQYITLQSPEELVERAFVVSGLFIQEAERRDGIKPLPPMKERYRMIGEADREAMNTRFPQRGPREEVREPAHAQAQSD